MQRFVIVGAGLAGHRAAIELRRLAPDASIVMLGDEPGLPYDRPPLSKKLLLGQAEPADIVFKTAKSYARLGIEHLAATRAAAIDRRRQAILAADGRTFAYDALLLATGSRPRLLPCPVEPEVPLHYLRTVEDAARLRAALTAGRHVAVIGGGFIGLEVAASASSRGCRVTVIEAAERILGRGMPKILGPWVQELHAGHGVDFFLGAAVEALGRVPGGGLEARLRGGAAVHADLVVAGIGVVPNVELAAEAGLQVGDGIVVDRQCRTSDPQIFAAGEVTCHPAPGTGLLHRIESWKIAADQPLVAAKAMLGLDAAFNDIPWLWSDQFDTNIQSLGRPDQGSGEVLWGDIASRSWTFVALDQERRPVGAVAVNSGRDITTLRRIMQSGGTLDAG